VKNLVIGGANIVGRDEELRFSCPIPPAIRAGDLLRCNPKEESEGDEDDDVGDVGVDASRCVKAPKLNGSEQKKPAYWAMPTLLNTHQDDFRVSDSKTVIGVHQASVSGSSGGGTASGERPEQTKFRTFFLVCCPKILPDLLVLQCSRLVPLWCGWELRCLGNHDLHGLPLP
jgi:hypothetical protein